MNNTQLNRHKKQTGSVLIISLVLLLIMTLLGISSIQMTTLDEKMAANFQDKQKSLQAAESAIRYALAQLDNDNYDIEDFVDNASTNNGDNGLYDLREDSLTNSGTGTKKSSHWSSFATVSNWDWSDDTKRQAVPDSTQIKSAMKLTDAPQYIIGMHDPVSRGSSEGYQCTPFTIIGAGRGSQAGTTTLVSVQIIPANTCFSSTVN